MWYDIQGQENANLKSVEMEIKEDQKSESHHRNFSLNNIQCLIPQHGLEA